MNNSKIYSITFDLLRNKHNQPIEMTLADLVDELENLNAMPKETIWQMRLAILHRDQEKLDYLPNSPGI
jgi:hypothetical protein